MPANISNQVLVGVFYALPDGKTSDCVDNFDWDTRNASGLGLAVRETLLAMPDEAVGLEISIEVSEVASGA